MAHFKNILQGDILAYNHATYLIPTYYSYPTIHKYVSVQELFVLSVVIVTLVPLAFGDNRRVN